MENPDQDKDTCPAADMETLANTAQPAVPDFTCHICGYKPRASASNPRRHRIRLIVVVSRAGASLAAQEILNLPQRTSSL